MNNLIKLKNNAILDISNLDSAIEEFQKDVMKYQGKDKLIIQNDEDKKALKKIRSELNKGIKSFESERLALRSLLLEPHDSIKPIIDEQVVKFGNDAMALIDETIKEYEQIELDEKEKELREYFKKENNILKYIEFEVLDLKINLSNSVSSLKKEIKEKLNTLELNQQIINTHNHSERLQVEYMKDYNLTRALSQVQEDVLKERKFKVESKSDEIKILEIPEVNAYDYIEKGEVKKYRLLLECNDQEKVQIISTITKLGIDVKILELL